ncbi:PREDICTED: afadin [Condylura cristata]|uniref:afadin n=1 Tax=Condylura cristata TaxID=143302 RepID=UPI0006433FCB|nr:PREDICTED: afadin [Condylura cristata]
MASGSVSKCERVVDVKDLEFHGVMRFYFQDKAAGNFATKCIRVSSTATTQDVIETLAEKFRPDMRMLSSPKYSLYEVHVSGEERRLDTDEKPLVVQLNWNKDDREGRFVLKNENDAAPAKKVQSNGPEKQEREGVIQNFRRTLSKKEKKEKKQREKEASRQASGRDERPCPGDDPPQDAPGPELVLPASIEFRESSEDAFLSAVINYTNSSTVHFKLSPTYVLYMACRHVLSGQYRPDASPPERTHKVVAIVNKMVSMMEGVIQELDQGDQKQKNIAGALAFWMANASELLNFIKQDRDLSRITLDAQDVLAHLVQVAFK